VKTDFLARMTGSIADAIHDFESGDESREQLLTAPALSLRHRNAGGRERCTRVDAHARIAQAVELESVREHSVG
jgi:hypothetical protein